MQNDTKNLHFLSYISGKVARDRQTNFKSPVLLHIEYRERERGGERESERERERASKSDTLCACIFVHIEYFVLNRFLWSCRWWFEKHLFLYRDYYIYSETKKRSESFKGKPFFSPWGAPISGGCCETPHTFSILSVDKKKKKKRSSKKKTDMISM